MMKQNPKRYGLMRIMEKGNTVTHLPVFKLKPIAVYNRCICHNCSYKKMKLTMMPFNWINKRSKYWLCWYCIYKSFYWFANWWNLSLDWFCVQYPLWYKLPHILTNLFIHFYVPRHIFNVLAHKYLILCQNSLICRNDFLSQYSGDEEIDSNGKWIWMYLKNILYNKNKWSLHPWNKLQKCRYCCTGNTVMILARKPSGYDELVLYISEIRIV